MKADIVFFILLCMFAFLIAAMDAVVLLAVYVGMGIQMGEIHLRQTVSTDKTNKEIAAMYVFLLFTWPLAFMTLEHALLMTITGPILIYAAHVLIGG